MDSENIEVGKRFEVDGVMLECVIDEEENCDGCYFLIMNNCDRALGLGCCSAENREDENSILFKEVKE